jgi:hypothetical protein
MNTARPKVILQDGTEFSACYEQSMGTNLVFALAKEDHHLMAKTDTVLRVESKPSQSAPAEARLE